MHWAIYLVGLTVGITNSRVTTVMSRGGVVPTTSGSAFLGFLAMLSTFGLLILGFVQFPWWLPVCAFVGIGLALAFVVTRRTLVFFHFINPGLAFATIAACGYGWWMWATTGRG